MDDYLQLIKYLSEFKNTEHDSVAYATEDNIVKYHHYFDYLTFKAVENTTISLNNYGGNKPILYYSSDGENFTQWDYSAISLNSGDKIYMYGNNPQGLNTSSIQYSKFIMGDGKIEADGDIQSLIDITCPTKIPCNYCFSQLFKSCTSLISMPKLTATDVTEYCYYSMFQSCSNLATVTELPALTLQKNCYQYMFFGCTSLTAAPTLPATELIDYCYYQMFSGCEKLNYIKAMFLDIPTTTSLSNWTRGVASNGTFVKNINATWDVTGANGIPTDWVVKTENE